MPRSSDDMQFEASLGRAVLRRIAAENALDLNAHSTILVEGGVLGAIETLIIDGQRIVSAPATPNSEQLAYDVLSYVLTAM